MQSMMTNMADGMKAAETAANSTGSAMAEQEKWMDSMEGKLGTLSATYESFATHLMDSEALKAAIEGLTALLSLLDKLTDSFGSIPVVAGAAFSIMAGMSGRNTAFSLIYDEAGKATGQLKIFGKTWADIRTDISRKPGAGNAISSIFGGLFADSEFGLREQDLDQLRELQQLINDSKKDENGNILSQGIGNQAKLEEAKAKVAQIQNEGSAASGRFAQSMLDTGQSVKVAEASVGKASLAFRALNGVLSIAGGMLQGLVAGAVIAGIIKLVSVIQEKFFPTMNQLKERAKESASAYEESVQKVEGLKGQLSDVQSQIKEINSQPLSVTSEAQLKTLESQSAELEKQIELEERLQEAKQKTAAEDILNLYDDGSAYTTADNMLKGFHNLFPWNAAMDTYDKDYEAIHSAGTAFANQYGVSTTSSLAKWADDLENRKETQEQLKKYTEELFKTSSDSPFLDGRQSYVDKTTEKLAEQDAELLTVYQQLSEQLDELSDAGIDENDPVNGNKYAAILALVSNLSKVLFEPSEQIVDLLNDEELANFTKKAQALADTGQLTDKTLRGIDGFDIFAAGLEKMGYSADDTTKILNFFKNQVDETAAAVESLSYATVSENLSSFKDYLQEYAEEGFLSAESVSNMLSEDPRYSKYLIEENGAYKLNQDAIDDYNQGLDISNGLLSEFVEQKRKEYEGTRENIGALSEYLNTLSNVDSKYSSLNIEGLSDITNSFANGDMSIADFFASIEEYSKGVDFSDFEASIEDLDETVQKGLISNFYGLGEAANYMNDQLSSGNIDVSEHSDGLMSMLGALEGYIADLEEALDFSEDSEIGEVFQDITDGLSSIAPGTEEALEAYDYFVEAMKEHTDYLMENASSEDLFEPPDEITDEYLDLVDDAVESFRQMDVSLASNGGASDQMLNQIQAIIQGIEGYEDAVVNSWDDVMQLMASSTEVGSAVIQGAFSDIQSKTSIIMNAIATVFRSLAELIGEFDATIELNLANKSFTTLDLGFTSIDIPENITYNIKGGSQQGAAVANAIASSVDSANQQLIKQQYSMSGILGVQNSGTTSGSTTAGDVSTIKDDDISSSATDAAKEQEDAAKEAAETAEKIEDINEKLKELDEEEHLDNLKKSIEEVDLLVQQLEASMESLDLQLELTSETDFAARMDIYSNKYDVAIEKGKTLRDEFNRLAATTPQTAAEAQTLADRLSELGSDIRENIKDVREYRKELDTIRLDSITTSAENAMEQLEKEQELLDYNLDVLTNGSMIGSEAFSFDFLLPELPEDVLDRQRKENEEIEQEEQRHQDTIASIKSQALEMEYAELAETREKERQDLIADLNETQQTINQKSTEISTQVQTKAVETGTAVAQTAGSAGTESAQNFVGNFKVLEQYMETNGGQFAGTFANAFIKGLDSWQTPIGEAVSSAITGGVSLGGLELAASLQDGLSTSDDVSSLDFYANGHNKYGGTHAKDRGIDYAHSTGTPIPAAWAGTVIKVADLGNRSYGKYVTIKSSDGKEHVYAHMSQQKVAVGQQVLKGQIIGLVGSTGKSTGPHVHVSNAWGTYIDTTGHATGGIVLPGEQSLVGEEGRELAKLPNGKIVMLGQHGAELCDLPAATKIINHEQTEEILKYTGSGIIGKTVKKYGGGSPSSDDPGVGCFAIGTVDPEWITLAQQIQSKYGIPASLVLAQLIQESGFGTSNLAVNANNYFGMKGTGTAGSQNGFQKYNSMAESFEAYAKNLLTSGYYNVSGLSSTDFNGWIESIAETYAPNQNYASKVKGVASSYNLTQYDSGITSIATSAVSAVKTAVEEAADLVAKYTEVPQAYTKEFLLEYRQYAEARAQTMKEIEDIKTLDAERARTMAETQRELDIEKSYQMKLDLYTQTAEKLKTNYTDLLAEFDKVKDTADVDVLTEYIEGLSTIQENLQSIDEELREAAHAIYEFHENSMDNKLSLLDNQLNLKKHFNDYAGMVANYNQQIALYEQAMKDAHEEAERVRATGASEDAEYIQDCISRWWEAKKAILEYKDAFEEIVEEQEESYKDALSEFQESYIQVFQDKIDDLEYQKSRDEALQGLYDQRDALEEINDARSHEIALMKAKENLAKLQKTTLVYQKGVGWVYQFDENALREAKDNLKNEQDTYDSWKLDEEIEELEKFYDDQIEDIQDFIEDLEYQMAVYLRETQQSLTDLMDTLRELGIDSFDNIKVAYDWFENLADQIANNEYLNSIFGSGTAADITTGNQQYDDEKEYQLLKQMMTNSQDWYSADGAEKDRLHDDNVRIAEILGLTYQDGIWYNEQGVNAYVRGAELLQQEIQNNINSMNDASAAEVGLLTVINQGIQNLYDFVTSDNENKLLREMIANSLAWHNATSEQQSQLAARNQEIGAQLGLTYDSVTGQWSDGNGTSAYGHTVLARMEANSKAWSNASAEEKNRLAQENQVLGKQLGLVYKNGAWYTQNGTKAYSSGGVIDYTGYALVHGQSANEMVLNNADVAKLYNYIHNTPNMIADAISGWSKTSLGSKNISTINNTGDTVYRFDGDIILQGVQNPDSFAAALKDKFMLQMRQKGTK